MKKNKQNIVTISPDLFLSNSIAIVGSSARMLEAQEGSRIDSFDNVVRFNRAPVEGYESFVGSKTTLRVANNHVFNNNQEDPKKWTGQPRYFIKNLKNSNILYFAKDQAPWWNRKENADESCNLYIVDYDLLEILKKQYASAIESDFSIGVGFAFLCVLSGLKPELFGFDISQESSRSHYWEQRPPAGPCHNVNKEKELLLFLEEHEKIIIN